ncbi:hypothetical protein [[Ruminococcus] torques]|uniref:hypothetical protein n=1 Tax=[Ruminococcus] torques TaxID=33039 RepID=UPI00351FCAEF
MEKKGGSSGVQAAGNQAKEAAKSGGTIAIKAAREAARIIKQDISLAMQKEEEQRKFHCESILAEESGQGPAASPGTSEMGIQKAVSVMIAAVFAAVQAALSFFAALCGRGSHCPFPSCRAFLHPLRKCHSRLCKGKCFTGV